MLVAAALTVTADWGARTVEVVSLVRGAEAGVATAQAATLRRQAETEALIIAAGYGMTPRQLAAFERDVDRLARLTAVPCGATPPSSNSSAYCPGTTTWPARGTRG